MLSLDEGKKAVIFARSVVENHVKKNTSPSFEFTKVFSENHGAFVTLHVFPSYDLRGCIGIPMPIMSLKDAIVEGAKSATHDPRFSPLSEQELDNIVVEVTILTKPELIYVNDPKDYLTSIVIGRDGLIVEQGPFKGLLLPQVPIEQGWDIEDFLSHTCMKAGLMPDSWFDKETKISSFTGQIFTEVKPHGEIKEKKINGSSC